MSKPVLAAALVSAAFFYGCSVQAQQVGQPCSQTQNYIQTKASVAGEGILQCIANGNGQYFWQPMGEGIPLYDATASCSIAGQLRWNGSAVQYCDGANWASLGSAIGKLYWDGSWGGNTYWCDSAYHIVMFHYDCGCSNNTTWFECQAN